MWLLLGCLIVLILAAFGAVSYDRRIRKKEPLKLSEWRNGLVSTLISVALGVAIALAMLSFESEYSDSQQRSKLISVLDANLARDYSALTVWGNETNKLDKSAIITMLGPEAVADATRSGLFELNEMEALTDISFRMRWYNTLCDPKLLFIATKEDLARLVDIIEDVRAQLLTKFDTVIQLVDLPITKERVDYERGTDYLVRKYGNYSTQPQDSGETRDSTIDYLLQKYGKYGTPDYQPSDSGTQNNLKPERLLRGY